MNYISDITRRDIFDLFKFGIDNCSMFDESIIFYPYFGRLDELDFLKRIYNLASLPSFDSRFENAEDDIWQHTINNNDYEDFWVFDDARFQLSNGADDIFLNFICEIFHPMVRDKKKDWKLFLKKINSLLQEDGYEIYSVKRISGKDVYGWKTYSKSPKIFFPFSIRFEAQIKKKEINFTLPKNLRYQIVQFLTKNNELLYLSDETGYNYTQHVMDLTFQDLKSYYVPHNYVNNRFIPSSNIDDFILHTTPYSVIDFIELFEKNSLVTDFSEKVVELFKVNNRNIIFKNGEISIHNNLIQETNKFYGKEKGVEELLIEANIFFEKQNYPIACEKIWDAFERLKTYYLPTIDKKQSIQKIIGQISAGDLHIEKIFNTEFKYLTDIGNNFRIRHHEKNKFDINEDHHYIYLYVRCKQLILYVLENIPD